MRVLRRELETFLILLPALFGMFCAGALVGAAIGMNAYIAATVAMGIWLLVVVLIGALRERGRAHEFAYMDEQQSPSATPRSPFGA